MRGSAHLVRRFFAVLRASRLRPAEQAEVAGLLRPQERQLFWEQANGDQRHGLECARSTAVRAPGRSDLARAALLHDLGKRGAGLGVLGRSAATALGFLHLPTPGRLGTYLAHGPAGAADLESAGAETLVVAYARYHHVARPAEVPARDWEVLNAADHD